MTHSVRAAMAGTLLEVLVQPGDAVEEGQDVVRIESMKMHLALQSDRAGKVVAVRAKEGAFVNEGDPLIDLEVR